jgi:hypothetical protein
LALDFTAGLLGRPLLAVALGTALLSGCAGDGPAPATATGDFERLQREVFNVSCITGACHNTQTRAGNLILSQGLSYDQLVGQPSENSAARRDGLLRVVPFATDESFLLIKVEGPTNPELGSRMPLGESPLSPELIDLMRRWITSGAAPGGAATATPIPSATATPPPTPTGTPVATTPPSPTASATHTATSVPTATAAPPTITGTRPPSATPTITGTPTSTPTLTETAVPSATATTTPTPTETSTAAPTPTVTLAPGSSFAEIQAEIFDQRCAVVGCHTDEFAPFNGDLSLQQGSSYNDLVGVEPMNAVARDAGYLRVDPGRPDSSFLLRKLTGPGSGEGNPMPLTGGPLSSEQIDRIRNWIARGADP